jgi:hypothetical protein
VEDCEKEKKKREGFHPWDWHKTVPLLRKLHGNNGVQGLDALFRRKEGHAQHLGVHCGAQGGRIVRNGAVGSSGTER